VSSSRCTLHVAPDPHVLDDEVAVLLMTSAPALPLICLTLMLFMTVGPSSSGHSQPPTAVGLCLGGWAIPSLSATNAWPFMGCCFSTSPFVCLSAPYLRPPHLGSFALPSLSLRPPNMPRARLRHLPTCTSTTSAHVILTLHARTRPHTFYLQLRWHAIQTSALQEDWQLQNRQRRG
jgi:hypothetical protein